MSEDQSTAGAAAATELTLPERAQKALAFAETKTQLEALAAQSKRITEIRDAASYAECHSARMALKNKRIDIQRAGKAAREDATKFSKEVIRVEGELVAIIEAEEKRLQALQDIEDAKKAEEKRLKIEAEERRVRGHQQRIALIRDLPFEALNDTIEGLEARLCTLANEAIGDDYEEFRTEAQEALKGTVDKLGVLLQQKREARAEQQRIERERAALEAERQAAAAERARQEQEDRERREADERAAAARRAEEDRQAEERRRAQAEEDERRAAAARAEEERQRKEAEERDRLARAERDRLENEQREARRQQEEREREEREAAAQREREELQRRQDELAEREAKLAAQRAQEEADRIARESEGLELLDVARDAHALLVEEGLEKRNRTLRLGFVLNRLLPKVAPVADASDAP